MDWPSTIFLCVVLFVGLPAAIRIGGRPFLAIRNPTAMALVAAWCLNQLAWRLTGDNTPTQFYIITDYLVLAVIFLREDSCDQSPYRGLWHQFQCLWIERHFGDRIIMSIFPIMWLLYAADIPDFTRWWALWWLALAQFIAAGVEAARGALMAVPCEEEARKPPGSFKLAVAGHV